MIWRTKHKFYGRQINIKRLWTYCNNIEYKTSCTVVRWKSQVSEHTVTTEYKTSSTEKKGDLLSDVYGTNVCLSQVVVPIPWNWHFPQAPQYLQRHQPLRQLSPQQQSPSAMAPIPWVPSAHQCTHDAWREVLSVLWQMASRSWTATRKGMGWVPSTWAVPVPKKGTQYEPKVNTHSGHPKDWKILQLNIQIIYQWRSIVQVMIIIIS